MKNTIGFCALVFGLSIGLSAQPMPPTWHANVPFDFYFGDNHYSAGEYEFSHVVGVIQLRNAAGRHQSFRIVLSPLGRNRNASEPEITFNKYGNDRVFFSRISDPIVGGYQVAKSRREKEMITSRMVAQNPRVVTISARARR